MKEHGQVHWTELMTDDVKAAKAFYAAVIGWDIQKYPMSEGDYWIAMQDGHPACGIVTNRYPGTPSRWFTYLAVDDVDSRLQQVVEKGGKVLREPFDIPSIGRIAIIQDPGGVQMGLITPEGESNG